MPRTHFKRTEWGLLTGGSSFAGSIFELHLEQYRDSDEPVESPEPHKVWHSEACHQRRGTNMNVSKSCNKIMTQAFAIGKEISNHFRRGGQALCRKWRQVPGPSELQTHFISSKLCCSCAHLTWRIRGPVQVMRLTGRLTQAAVIEDLLDQRPLSQE